MTNKWIDPLPKITKAEDLPTVVLIDINEVEQRVEDQINHPRHYANDNPAYEAIKVIEAWGLDFCLGNTVKYISRAGKKPGNSELQDLQKALWYLTRRIQQVEGSL